MIRIKSKLNLYWPMLGALFTVSAVYFLAAIVLLQPDNNNINFIEEELRGLRDYKIVLALSFDLYQTRQPDDVKSRILLASGNNFPAIWEHAQTRVRDANSVEDVSFVLRNMMRDVGDSSNLILDPQLESYYAVDILFNQVPSLLSHVSTAHNPSTTARVFEALDHSLQIITRQSGTSDRLAADISALKSEWNAAPSGEPTLAQQKAMLNGVNDMAQAASEILEDLLRHRLAAQREDRLLAMTLIIGLYAGLVALIMFAVRNHVYKREIKSAIERQELNERLARKNEELESFTFVAAHDIKEPVRTIRCFSTLLKEEVPQNLDPAARDYLRIIDSAAVRAEQMINDLLRYAKLSRESLTLETCACRDEVMAVLQDIDPLIKTTQARIEVGELPTIATVPSLFRRVIQNLVDNAIKYHRPGVTPDIRIDAEQRGAAWLFHVKDNGIGVDHDLLEAVFDPFKRLHPGINSEGHGIGLTSCKKIVEMLGGKIELKSEPGKGSTFTFTLPANT